MRTIFNSKSAISLCLIALIFFSCKKDYTPASNNIQISKSITSSSVKGDTVTLILQPGPNDGEDAFVEALNRQSVQTNYNIWAELAMDA